MLCSQWLVVSPNGRGPYGVTLVWKFQIEESGSNEESPGTSWSIYMQIT
jgi:hypothetical protein